MNKLLEIRNMWIKENEDYLLGWGLSLKLIESIADDIVKHSVEYTESKCRESLSLESIKKMNDKGIKNHASYILQLIDQDLTSLNN